MLFIMFCEFYYLLLWATIGVSIRWDSFPDIFHAIPWILGGAALFFSGVDLCTSAGASHPASSCATARSCTRFAEPGPGSTAC